MMWPITESLIQHESFPSDLYVWYGCTIDWFEYIDNITLINNCFCLLGQIKGVIFCFTITLYIFKLKNQYCHKFKPFQFSQ